MSEITDKIAAIVAARRQRLPEVQSEIEQWHLVEVAINHLQRAVHALREHPSIPPDLAAQLDGLNIDEVRLAITKAIERAQHLQARFARSTVCIGLGGPANSGKSTLIQSISGLTDAQVATGARTPVTAVPSRISHAAGPVRAVLALHTFDTFRVTQLQPRYARAGLGEPPGDVEEFRAFVFPPPCSPPAGALRELRSMQRALWSYERLLDRPDRILELTGGELDRLAEYLAYPGVRPAEERTPHRYLGVRHARIEYPFPSAEHRAVALVDLPGGGASDLARLLSDTVAGHELDVVLLVVRRDAARPPGDPGSARLAELTTSTLVGEMSGCADIRRDLVVLVTNEVAEATHRADSGRHRPSLRRLQVDASQPGDVTNRLLEPLLRHLAERLPGMDADLSEAALVQSRPVHDQVLALATQTRAVLRRVPPMTPSFTQDLYRRSDEVFAGRGVALREALVEVQNRTTRDETMYRAAVADIQRGLVGWLRDGLGVGVDLWCSQALRAIIRDGGAASYANAQFGRVRTEISDRYSALDHHLRCGVEQVWTDLAAVLDRDLGKLLRGRSGAAALALLAEFAAEGSQPCPRLRASIEELLALRIDYRTHLYPHVWADVDALRVPVPEFPTSADGASRLYQFVCTLAERVVLRVRGRLLGQSTMPGRVLCAAVVRFIDSLDSVSAERELRNLAGAYRRELWPQAFADLDRTDICVARVARAAHELLDAAAGFGCSAPRSR